MIETISVLVGILVFGVIPLVGAVYETWASYQVTT